MALCDTKRQNTQGSRMIAFLKTVLTKLGYSLDGLRYGWAHEPSVRQWAMLAAVSDIAALLIFGVSTTTGAVFALGFLLVASELINTAVELLVDHVHPEKGPVAKHAKDVASAMTFLTSLALGSVWIFGLLS